MEMTGSLNRSFTYRSLSVSLLSPFSLPSPQVLLCAYIVFLMSLGFALAQAGAVKAVNTKNIIAQCSYVTLISIMCFWIIGFGFTQGTSMVRTKRQEKSEVIEGDKKRKYVGMISHTPFPLCVLLFFLCCSGFR